MIGRRDLGLMMKKKPEHYVNNKELLEALIVYRSKIQEAKEKKLPKPKVTNYLGDCFLKIATHLSYKPNFVNYMFRDDMISDGVENCFHRSTIIPTIEYGPIEIEKIVNKKVTIRCIDGKWREALVKSYGTQMLYEYGFSSFNVPEKDVYQKVICTENHRWFVSSRGKTEVITDLKICDYLHNAPIENNYNKNAIICGFLYECEELQRELPSTKNPEFIAGFIHGWWLSNDYEHILTANQLQIGTPNSNAAQWLISYAPYAGLHVIDHRIVQRANDEGIIIEPLNVITLAKPEHYQPKVRYIKEYGEDEVFCLEEPETNSFVLGNGLLTGNCIQYIHNFDPEKSRNPFAYFTQIIHYAFLRRIQKEKKQLEVKTKLIERSGYDEVMVIDEGHLSGSSAEYNSIKDAIQYRGNR